ncbi:MAG: TIGR03936 family radical SAM-associated protein, partial [Acidimicrobiales bacterium]
MRLRFRFSKLGKVRWTSHRDTARMWERALRRIALPVAYTGGFSPRPKVSFGLALPTGHESVAEYLDVEVPDGAGPLDPAELAGALTPALPHGIDVLAATAVDPGAGSLQEDVTSCRWELAAGATAAELEPLVDRVLRSSSLVATRERKGRPVTDDIRPAILSLAVLGDTPAGGLIACELATQPRSLRPAELVGVMAPGLVISHGRRTHQWIERDGARREPLPLGPTAAHLMRRDLLPCKNPSPDRGHTSGPSAARPTPPGPPPAPASLATPPPPGPA